jgi:hypothetical protein
MANMIDRAREALSDTEFPADRNTLVVSATEHGDAGEDVLHALTVLPEGIYSSLDHVTATLRADDDRSVPTSGRRDIVRDDD